jgi:hypothetical protein
MTDFHALASIPVLKRKHIMLRGHCSVGREMCQEQESRNRVHTDFVYIKPAPVVGNVVNFYIRFEVIMAVTMKIAYSLLCCDPMQSGRSSPLFRRKGLPASSG